MFITNAKVLTTRDQNDLETLEKFATNLFAEYSEAKKIEPPLDVESHFEERTNYSGYRVPDGMSLTFLLDAGCEYMALEQDDMIEKPGQVLTLYKHIFNQQEQLENSEQLVRYMNDKSAQEDELREVKSSYKAKIDEAEALINKYRNFVGNGYDMRDEKCKVLINFKDRSKQYISVSTNKVIKTEELTSEDYQLFLAFSPLPAVSE